MRREERLVELVLGPLSRPDTDTLVRVLTGAGGGEAAARRCEEQVWRISEGNPFTAVEVVRALHDASSPLADAWALPQRVREVVAGRLERLSASGQGLIAVAAVIGRDFEFALLWRAAGVEETEAATAVEELGAAPRAVRDRRAVRLHARPTPRGGLRPTARAATAAAPPPGRQSPRGATLWRSDGALLRARVPLSPGRGPGARGEVPSPGRRGGRQARGPSRCRDLFRAGAGGTGATTRITRDSRTSARVAVRPALLPLPAGRARPDLRAPSPGRDAGPEPSGSAWARAGARADGESPVAGRRPPRRPRGRSARLRDRVGATRPAVAHPRDVSPGPDAVCARATIERPSRISPPTSRS